MLKGESNYILKRDGTEGETKIGDRRPNPTSMGADLRYMHAYQIPPEVWRLALKFKLYSMRL